MSDTGLPPGVYPLPTGGGGAPQVRSSGAASQFATYADWLAYVMALPANHPDRAYLALGPSGFFNTWAAEAGYPLMESDDGGSGWDWDLGKLLLGDEWYEFWGRAALFGLGVGVGALVGAGAVWAGVQASAAVGGGLWGAVASITTTGGLTWAATGLGEWVFTNPDTGDLMAENHDAFMAGAYLGGIFGAALEVDYLYAEEIKDFAVKTGRALGESALIQSNIVTATWSILPPAVRQVLGELMDWTMYDLNLGPVFLDVPIVVAPSF